MELSKFGIVVENASLTNYNTYGIKTSAKYLVKPDTVENLKGLMECIELHSEKYYVLGKGSNVILPDEEFEGVIISLENLDSIKINGNVVEALAGVTLSKLAFTCIDNNLGGFEYLALIPGSLGGSLYGNAGAYNHDIYEYLDSLVVIRNNKLITIPKSKIKYSYRNTEFKNSKDIIVGAKFLLNHKDKKEMLEFVNESRLKRTSSQPLEYKNAGSVFKNPKDNYAGKLIEDLGLKGYKINDAMVSLKHANFIVNLGNAKSEDIKNLINYIKTEVKKHYNIDLELEQIIVEW